MTCLHFSQVATGLRPEMIATIREYDPDRPHTPITLAWDETQKHVRGSFINDATQIWHKSFFSSVQIQFIVLPHIIRHIKEKYPRSL